MLELLRAGLQMDYLKTSYLHQLKYLGICAFIGLLII